MQLITEQDMEKIISSNEKVIVQFSADWCNPCKKLTPILENFANTRDDVSVYKVDIAEQQNLAKRYSVMSIPKLVLFTGGNQTRDAVGFMDDTRLKSFVDG